MKKILTAIMCLLLAVSMFTGCTVVNEAEAGNVNGEKILMGEYKYAATMGEIFFGAMDYSDPLVYICMYDPYLSGYLYSDIVALYSKAGEAEEGKTIWEKELEEGITVGDTLKEIIFEALVKIRLANEKAAELGIVLDETELASIDEAKNNIIEQLGSNAVVKEALEDINYSEKALINLWTQIAVANKLKAELTDVEAITDEQIAAYYAENYMRVKHILVKVGDDIADLDAAKAVAGEITAKLESGENFEELMKEYTDDVDSEGNINGGDIGYVFKEGDFGNPSFEKASKALEVGSLTAKPVEVKGSSYSGYHFIKRYALEDSFLNENTDSIRDIIKNAIVQDAYDAEIEALFLASEVNKSNSKIRRIKLKAPETISAEPILAE